MAEVANRLAKLVASRGKRLVSGFGLAELEWALLHRLHESAVKRQILAMRKSALVLSLLCLLPLPAKAQSFGLVGDGGAVSMRLDRCTNRRREPEIRISACQRLIDDNSGSSAQAWRELAAAYEEQNDTAKALEAYATMIAHRDNGALELRAALYARTDDYEKAMADIVKYEAMGGEKQDVLNFRCWVRGLAGKELEAGLADCDEALRLKPDDADAQDTRCFILFRLGQMSDAAAACSEALRKQPRTASSLYLRGVIEKESGDTETGDRDIAAAVSFDSKIVQIYMKYGVPTPISGTH